jgi:lysozyme
MLLSALSPRCQKAVLLFGLPVVFIMVALIFYNCVLGFYRPALRAGEVYGIDVSEHQQLLDWSRVAADNIAFVYVKATEGSSSQDKQFAHHWSGARQAGLRTGAYHYFSLCSPGTTQADNFLKTVEEDADMLPPVLDLEFSPFCRNQPTRQEVLRHVDTFMQKVSAATNKDVILYVGIDFDATYGIRRQYGEASYWKLRYLRRPEDSRDRMWQVGNFFRVQGTHGKVDLNVARIDEL